MATPTAHIGENIRAIRQLKGMKQEVFARELGIAQQNVSKMEKKAKVSQKKLEEAANILGVTVDVIKKFNEKTIFNNNMAFGEDNQVNHFNPVQEIIAYFKEELSKKDAEIKALKDQLQSSPGSKGNTDQPGNSRLSATR